MPRKRFYTPVPPVSRDGVRYEQVAGRRDEFGQIGGVVAAVDEQTGKELWAVVVYKVEYDKYEEQDAQDVFLTSLAVGPDGNHLLVENERKKQFAINLADRTVRPV